MTPPEWVQRFHLMTWQYAVPVLFGPPPPLKSGQKVQTGTCVVVEHAGHRFVLSAAHVLLEALRAVQSGLPTDVVVGPLEMSLTLSSVRYADESRVDVATLPLTDAEVARIERAGHRAFRPVEWPPPTVTKNDSILMVGYPGAWRLPIGADAHDFRATTQGLIVQSVHDAEFIAHRDPAFGDPVSVSLEDVPPLGVGGCSGGPVFLVRDEPILIPRLCGIVKEGLAVPGSDDILLRFARLDVTLGPDGTVRSPTN